MKTEKEEEIARLDYIGAAGKLPLHAFRKQFKFHINYGIADISISRLMDKSKYGYDIDWDVYLPSKMMNLQRDFVWTLQQKQELILSILKGINIPPITVILFKSEGYRKNDSRGLYRIIDGKQRLSSVMSFCAGEFSIPYNSKDYFFHDLTPQAQRTIDDCFRSNTAYEYEDSPISDEDKIAWFEMINFAGTPQDVEHLQKLKSGQGERKGGKNSVYQGESS